ncbi:hypothetical protein DPMN_071577 [Dreissena polymorpha]|uniref:Uncharacterized protein n=1 Tax=Dreissena polymorpha TaxID=45954 RepID=A0A9D4BPS6_DREPO|nr:hypothetical protein DPMN_071577 [Dreissena polymorpha]
MLSSYFNTKLMSIFLPRVQDNNYLCDSDGSPIVLLTPRCLADDAGEDAWVLINFRNIIPESVRIQSRIGSDVSCYSNSHYSETSSAYSDTSSTDSDTSLTYSETSSNDSGEEVSVNPCHASYYSLWNHRVRRSIFLLEENPFSCRILDRSIPSSLNSSSISTSSISLCVPVESNSSPEANSQIENESASNSDTEVNKFNSLSEVKEDNAANTACSNEDTDETVVDNSCAWFWCKSDREEATTVVENASSVHTVNTEETQKAPVAVECYNTFSKSRKFKR